MQVASGYEQLLDVIKYVVLLCCVVFVELGFVWLCYVWCMGVVVLVV